MKVPPVWTEKNIIKNEKKLLGAPPSMGKKLVEKKLSTAKQHTFCGQGSMPWGWTQKPSAKNQES